MLFENLVGFCKYNVNALGQEKGEVNPTNFSGINYLWKISENDPVNNDLSFRCISDTLKVSFVK